MSNIPNEQGTTYAELGVMEPFDAARMYFLRLGRALVGCVKARDMEQPGLAKDIREAQADLTELLASENGAHTPWAPSLPPRLAPDVALIRQRAIAIAAFRDVFCDPMFQPMTTLFKLASPQDTADGLYAARRQIIALCESGELVLDEDESPGLRLGSRLLKFFIGDSRQSRLLLDEEQRKRLDQPTETPPSMAEAEPGQEGSEHPPRPKAAMRPRALFMQVRRKVIGMDAALRTVCARLKLHTGKAELIRTGRDPGTPNECVLLIGPSGAGKTYLAEQASLAMGLPFASVSATDLTAEGYVGMSIEHALRQLVQAAGGDTEKARHGICFFDEWDKKAARDSTGFKDIGGRAVQNEMLRLMEGCKATYSGRRPGAERPLEFDSRGTFFFFAGAFNGLDEIRRKRSRLTEGMGFSGSPSDSPERASDYYEALNEFGMIPEFLNRLTAIIRIPEPTVSQLRTILIAPTGIVAAFNRQLALQGATLKLERAAADRLTEFALHSKTYSRGLKMTIGTLIEDAVFRSVRGTVHIGIREMEAALALMGESTAGKTPQAMVESA